MADHVEEQSSKLKDNAIKVEEIGEAASSTAGTADVNTEDGAKQEASEAVGAAECAGDDQSDEKTHSHTLDIPDDIPHFSEESLLKLSQGLEAKCLPQLEKAKATLEEITDNQRILIETAIQENSKFQDSESMKEVTSTMEKAKLYHNKLVHIKKDMLQLHEKSAKLKKRALKLQQQKQKELLQQEQEREKHEERERQLVAQPARSTAKSKS